MTQESQVMSKTTCQGHLIVRKSGKVELLATSQKNMAEQGLDPCVSSEFHGVDLVSDRPGLASWCCHFLAVGRLAC